MTWLGRPRIKWSPYIPHTPHPKQHAALYSNDLDLLYGGAAGGGKSDFLLMAAAQYVDVAGYSALILRKTYADLALPGALIARAKEWWMNTDAHWSEIDKTWTFPSGATITFGYLQTTNDKYRYQSTEFDLIELDELTQFPEEDFKYMFSRIRQLEGSRIPPRFRAATNPGGRSHKQVKRRYIDRVPDPDDIEETQEQCDQRIFIPAKLWDNASIDQAGYVRSLSQLDPRTRKQLLEGDWSVREPGAWVYDEAQIDIAKDIGRDLDALRRVGQIQPVGGHLRIAADFGTHTHILVLWPLEGGGWYVVKEIVFDGYDITKAVEPTVAAIEATGFRVERFDFDGSTPGLATIFHDALKKSLGYKFKYLAVPFNKFKRLTIQHINWMLDRTANEQWPRLAISPTGAPRLLEQMERLYYDDPETDRIHKEDDHGPDALIAGLAEDASKRDHRFKEKTAA